MVILTFSFSVISFKNISQTQEKTEYIRNIVTSDSLYTRLLEKKAQSYHNSLLQFSPTECIVIENEYQKRKKKLELNKEKIEYNSWKENKTCY